MLYLSYLVAIFYLFVAMEMGVWQKNVQYIFLLSKTHSTVWAKIIALFEFLNKSYPCGVSPRKRQCDFFLSLICNNSKTSSLTSLKVLFHYRSNMCANFIKIGGG